MKKNLILITVLFVAMILLIAGFFVYQHYYNSKPQIQNSNLQTQSVQPTTTPVSSSEKLITVVSPNGGEAISLGNNQEYDVKWSVKGIADLQDYYVKLSLVKGGTILGVISNKTSTASAVAYNWNWIGAGSYIAADTNVQEAPAGNDYRIKAELYKVGDSSTSKIAEDYSDAYFSIVK
jgi:hypothetical protein